MKLLQPSFQVTRAGKTVFGSGVANTCRCLLALGLFLMPGLAPTAQAKAPKTRMIGADISWVQEQEEQGLRFSDTGGKTEDILTILKRHGFNAVRLRVFVDPKAVNGYSAKGYCDLQHTLQMAKRVKAAGMRLALDLHYSDTWADPAHQTKPAAWADFGTVELRKAVYRYTYEVMSAFAAQHTTPEIIQIGNEITGGFLWPEGQMWKPGREQTFCRLVKTAINAVHTVSPDTRIMLHTATGGRNGDCRAFLDLLERNDVPFDILGVSYYTKFEGGSENLRRNLNDLVKRCPQDIVVAEYTAPDQADVHKIVWDLPNGRGVGTFIWEPTKWPSGSPALFDEKGRSKEALWEFDAFPNRKSAQASPSHP